MARLLGLAEDTLFAELIERSMDALFDEQFSENGTFVERVAVNRQGRRDAIGTTRATDRAQMRTANRNGMVDMSSG